MTNLQLCRRLARFAEITNRSDIPAAVTGQTGNLLDVVDWLNDAWVGLQNSQDNWRWMRSKFTFNTTASDAEYAYTDVTDSIASAAISRFRRWLVDNKLAPSKCYLTSGGIAGQHYLTYIDWNRFQTIYQIGTVQSGKPVHISIDPLNNLVLGPTPDAIYTVTGEYMKSAQQLTADGDIPELPTEYHMLLVYEALQIYAFREAAPEVLALAQREGMVLKSGLLRTQLPKMMRGAPLV